MENNFIDELQFGEDIRKISPQAENVRYNAPEEGALSDANDVQTALDILNANTSPTTDSTIANKGYFGANYPTQMKDIMELETNKSDLHFIHITDTHDSAAPFTMVTGRDGLLGNTFADFLVHTGDAVADNYMNLDGKNFHWDSIINNETKPCYFVLGNHECYLSPSLADRYNKYFSNLNWAQGVEEQGKTYYHADIVKGKSKFKCLFIDYADGGLRDNYSDSPTNWATNAVMTDEQKIWFIEQLQDAAANDYHVLCFTHVTPDRMPLKDSLVDDSYAQGWINTYGGEVFYEAPVLCNILDAFIAGTHYNFNGTEYTFERQGKFVGWFAGHTHYDGYAWSPNHKNQFINIAKKTCEYNSGWHIANCKYISVDYNQKKVTIYNVGNIETRKGRKLIKFSYNY